MGNSIPQSAHDLFERPVVGALSTVNPNGQPHTVPVWCDRDDKYVRVNSPDATRKAHNMIVGSKVTLLLLDPQNAFHWCEVQGHIVEVRDEAHGARDHINGLARKYTGDPVYHDAPHMSKVRLMYLIQPDKVNGW